SLLAGDLARSKGFEQVLWLDAKEKKFAEEVGAMNIFFVIDGVVKTPALVGSILAGITRDSVIKLLKDEGIPVEETRISVDELFEAYKNGTLNEVFGSGTAAVISPVGVLGMHGKEYIINNFEMGSITSLLYDRITGIQCGRENDKFDWVTFIN
ncbi:MAG: aminotransferase class IV, partial [Clostridia bacterium]|nr:aminotransferase class IV [Clostridia bacterium]